MPSRRPRAVQSSVATTARICGFDAGSRAVRRSVASTRHWPSIRRWECRVTPLSSRWRMCLPRLTTSSVVDAAEVERGQRRPAQVGSSVSGSPARAWSRRAAVRQHGVALRHRRSSTACESQPARGGVEAGLRQRGGDRVARAEHLAAVGLLDGESARGRPRGRRAPARRPPRCSASASSVQEAASCRRARRRATSSPSTSTTSAPALRPGWWPGRPPCRRARGRAGPLRRRSAGPESAGPRLGPAGQWRAPYGFAGSLAARTTARRRVVGRGRTAASGRLCARSRSTAPVVANCAAPEPLDEVAAAHPPGLLGRGRAPGRPRRSPRRRPRPRPTRGSRRRSGRAAPRRWRRRARSRRPRSAAAATSARPRRVAGARRAATGRPEPRPSPGQRAAAIEARPA